MKKYVSLISLIVLTIALLLSVIDLLSVDYKTEIKELNSSEVDLNQLSYDGLDVSGNHFTSNNDDPQINLPCIDKSINAVKIEFSNPLSLNQKCQVYYAVNGEGLRESNSVIQDVNAGTSSIIISLENQIYTSLRFDLAGDYYIESINLQLIEKHEIMIVDIIAWFFAIMSTVGLLIVILLFRKDIMASISDLKKKYFSTELKTDNGLGKKLANVYLVIASVTGLLVIYLMPPSTAPDENAHFPNILRIGGGSFFGDVLQDNGEKLAGDYITVDEINYLNTYSGIYNGTTAQRQNYADVYNMSFLPTNNQQKQFFSSVHASINPASYIIPSASVFVAKKIFNVTNPYNLMIWGKIANLLLSVIFIRLAILKTPILKKSMFLLALFPMTIQQCASLSYDAPAITGAFLLFAYGMKCALASDDYRINREDVAAICLSCALIFCSKIAYCPLVLILLAISIKKFGSIKKYIICIGTVILIGIVFYALPSGINNAILSGSGNLVVPFISDQRAYLLSHISSAPAIIVNTVGIFFNFWKNSIFAQLGWLDTLFPEPFIDISLVLFCFVAAYEICSFGKINWKLRVLSILGPIVFLICTIFVMYISWTPMDTNSIGGDYATGIQGRYFIPVLLFIPLAFANPLFEKFKYRKNCDVAISYFSVNLGIFFAAMTVVVLITRYWC